MSIHRLKVADAKQLRIDGKTSTQILCPGNAPDAQITITRVVMEPGAISPQHSHPRSEQTWIVESGSATLLLADGKTAPMERGDVLRTPIGEVHGIENTGVERFVYLTITAPPEDMSPHYAT